MKGVHLLFVQKYSVYFNNTYIIEKKISFITYSHFRSYHMWLVLLLTHWGRVMHICISKLTTIGSDNGLAPDRRPAIIWTNAGILLIGPLGTNLSEILNGIYTFSLKKMHLKMSSGKWRPSCLGLNVLKQVLLIPTSTNDAMTIKPYKICLGGKVLHVWHSPDLVAYSEPLFSIKVSSHQHRKSYCGDKIAIVVKCLRACKCGVLIYSFLNKLRIFNVWVRYIV